MASSELGLITVNERPLPVGITAIATSRESCVGVRGGMMRGLRLERTWAATSVDWANG